MNVPYARLTLFILVDNYPIDIDTMRVDLPILFLRNHIWNFYKIMFFCPWRLLLS